MDIGSKNLLIVCSCILWYYKQTRNFTDDIQALQHTGLQSFVHPNNGQRPEFRIKEVKKLCFYDNRASYCMIILNHKFLEHNKTENIRNTGRRHHNWVCTCNYNKDDNIRK